jgi:hypothetical protein
MTADERPGGPWIAAKKVGLLIATTLLSINVWTGSPLLALWVGSRVQGGGGLSMTAVFTVVVVLAVLVMALTWALAWLNARYERLAGTPPAPRQPPPWLRSMRGEREVDTRRRSGITPLERIVVGCVVAAVIVFEIWFFFFAGSSLPSY